MVQHSRLDASFAALSDPTRRGILEHLGRTDATVSELAERFEMTLTGITKHLRLLEDSGMVVTEKRGRVRHCRLGTNPFDRELAWIRSHQLEIEGRLDRLGQFLNRMEE
ncbi:winged helix-turn-helix transcriptional regulator [Rhodococcus oryzae]|uniref:Winged helix-turn-helix transcriptional regulator n=1 Tax=Rhodococcus oryzae TaxID=2571143 RepID=A0ABY2RJ89_9NOCA|nr:metalloregulator ArsR/SmtB family transcription factor [Rhodococcus oryzae]TJZ77091.1 winged helix-turn-helix transcriptional regulator [Rhodococcus oryzae]